MGIKDYFKYWGTSDFVGIKNQVIMDSGIANLRTLNDSNSPNYIGKNYFDLIKDNNPLSPVQGEYESSFSFSWLIVGGIIILLFLIFKK